MFSCRIVDKVDFYDTLCEWWSEWKFPVLDIDSLPNNIFVVSKNEIDLYAIPVWLSDSNMCLLGFISGNKRTKKTDRANSLDYLVKYTESYLKDSGRKYIITVSGTPVLKKLFSDNDYILTGNNINEYIKKL